MPRPRKYKKKPRISKKYQRKKTTIARMPFVEQKVRETSNTAQGVAPIMNLSSNVTVMVPDSFEFMSQGDTASSMSGRWLYSKWLTSKLLVDYQPCIQEMSPLTLIMYQGWCKLNLNPTLPTNGGVIPSLSTTALQTHVAQVFAAAYEDPLGTGDARRLKILRKQVLYSSPRTLVQPDGHSEAFRSNKMINLKWDVQRKIRYNHCQTGPAPGVSGNGTPFIQCNTGNWVPFIAFRRAPTDTTALAHYPAVHYKHRHYFTDA